MLETENKKICNGDVISYYKENFINYVAKLPIEDSFKNLIADEEFIADNPIFYLYYPRLFSSAFTELNPKDLDLLCVAGYLYYKSTLFLDSIIDKNSKKGLFLALICQEEATKIMTSIFGLKSSYWSLWNLRRQEYLKAIQIEKKYAETKNNIPFNQYAELADFKAAFGKSAIDSLFVCSGSIHEQEFNRLLTSHSYFSVAFQINDDVMDFREDYRNKQFNIAVKAITDAAPESNAVEELNKLFYIRGHAKTLFTTAIEYLDKALTEVKNIEVPQWTSEITRLKSKFLYSIIEIDTYLKRLHSEIRLSDQKITYPSLPIGISSGILFLKDSQNEQGSWNEYINQGGISDIWSTAYITSKLSEENLKNEFKAEIQNALSFLKTFKPKHLWGYNSTWIGDADTTNFVLLSFFLNNLPDANSILDEWIEYFKEDQGFSTYKNTDHLINSLADEKISDVSRWVGGHQCVSAVAFYYMSLSKKFPLKHAKLDDLFQQRLLVDDAIAAFWWTSNIYTLYYLTKSYAALNKPKIVKAIALKTAELQNEDGSFSDKYGPNFFITALALENLLHEHLSFEKHIHQGIQFLLNNQYTDGSWENSNTLQIPDPATEDTDKHYPVSTHGTSVRAREFNRLFTTVSVLETLISYEKAIASTSTL